MEGPQHPGESFGDGAAEEMSGKLEKKIRRVARIFAERSGREYVDSICKYPFGNKLLFCWFILRHKEAKV